MPFWRRSLLKAVTSVGLAALFASTSSAQVGLPPIILVQPLDAIVLNNGSATLLVSAGSSTTMSYKWYKDGTLISGATAATYTITGASALSEGGYYVEIRNSSGTTVSRTARVTVLLANDIPVAAGDSYTSAEDVRLTVGASGILANDTDSFGGALTALLVGSPTNGAVTLNADGSFTYLPNSNFFGADLFTYRVLDGELKAVEQNDSGTKNVTLQRGNRGSQSFAHGTAGGANYWIRRVKLYLSRESTAPNTNFVVSIGTGINSGTLPNALVSLDPLTITNTTTGASFQPYEITFPQLVGPLTAGTTYYLNLENEASNDKDIRIAWPDANTYLKGGYFKNGTANSKDIRFILGELLESAVAEVRINVTPVNDAPVPENDTASTEEDTSVSIAVMANDADLDSSALTLVSAFATNGTVEVSDANVIFTPATNFHGRTTFTYVVSDGFLSATGTVAVLVAPVNDDLSALDDTYSATEDTALVIGAAGVLSNDFSPLGNPLTALLASGPANGTVSFGTDGSFVYWPNTDFTGTDSFTYVISEGEALVAEENTSGGDKVEIRDDEPTAQSFRHGVIGDASYRISKVAFRISRKDDQTKDVYFSIGTAVNSTPFPGTEHTVSMTSVSDVSAGNDFHEYLVTYDPPIGPFAAGSTYYLNFSMPADGRDVYLERSLASTYARGTSYRKGSDEQKDLMFSIYASAVSSVATVDISVMPVNDAPVAFPDSTNTLEDISVAINVLANDTDVDGPALNIASVFAATGTAVIAGTNIVFTPPTNASGTFMFSYTVTDGTASSSALVTIVVDPVNDAPSTAEERFSTIQNTPLTIANPGVLVNDTDVDDDTLIALLESEPRHGSIVFNADGSFIYTPRSNYFGADSFSYRSSDGANESRSTTVHLTTSLTNVLTLQPIGPATNGFRLLLSGPSPAVCTILVSSNNTSWTPISTNMLWSGPLEVIDANAASRTMSFYRASIGTQSTIVLEQSSSGGAAQAIKAGSKGAQSFTHDTADDANYSVSKITFYASRSSTVPNAPLNVSIGTGTHTNAIVNSSVVIDPSSITNDSSGASFQLVEVMFPTPVVLVADTTYYINFDCDAPNGGSIYIDSSQTGSGYSGGKYFRNGANAGGDVVFDIWGQ